LAALPDFYPNAKQEDRRVEVAGQRGQVIKKDAAHRGTLELVTELVPAADRFIVAILGASPGASTAAWIMIHVIELCFAEKLKDGGDCGSLPAGPDRDGRGPEHQQCHIGGDRYAPGISSLHRV
jgi:hypothetical protein